MTSAVARKEEERAEIEIHQESILQVTSIHHQLTNEEEKHEVSNTPEYPYLATVGYVGGKDKGRLELSVEDQKISFDLFEAMKHLDMGDAHFEEEMRKIREFEVLGRACVVTQMEVRICARGSTKMCLFIEEDAL